VVVLFQLMDARTTFVITLPGMDIITITDGETI